MGGMDHLHRLYGLYNILAKSSNNNRETGPPKTVGVSHAIVDVIASQQRFDATFKVTPNSVLAFVDLLEQALPFFSPFVSSKNYIRRICRDVLPKFDDIIKLDNGENFCVSILKYLAEISLFFKKEDKIEDSIEFVYDQLLKYIPLPAPTEGENDLKTDESNLQFTHIECLLFTFVQFLKQNDEFITSSDSLKRFKDLKSRLRFLYKRILDELENIEEPSEIVIRYCGKQESEAVKAIKLKIIMMNNIKVLIKDFFRRVPSFNSIVTLSWKSVKSHSQSSSLKRESDSSTVRIVKRERRARDLSREQLFSLYPSSFIKSIKFN